MAKSSQIAPESPTGEQPINLDLDYLEKNVMVAQSKARDAFKRFMVTGKGRKTTLFSLYDLMVAMIGSGRYKATELKGIQTTLTAAQQNLDDTASLTKTLNETLLELQWLIAKRGLFHKEARPKKTLRERL